MPYGRYTSPLVSIYEQIKDNQETTSFIDNSRIIFGREKDKEKIIKVLLETIRCSSSSSDSRVSVLPIVGMGGWGRPPWQDQSTMTKWYPTPLRCEYGSMCPLILMLRKS